MSQFKAIPSDHISPELGTAATQKELTKVSWYEPAKAVFDDFKEHEPIIVDASDTLAKTESLLNHSGQRYACVSNSRGNICGLVALREFYGRRAMQLALQAQVPRGEVCVSELMVSLAQLPQIELRLLSQARIGDAAATLKTRGYDFLAIKEGEILRGVISSLRIAEVTGESVNVYHSASTFAEIMTAVSHGELID